MVGAFLQPSSGRNENQSTASSTAYPIPIEKVKNGYDYIIRGMSQLSTDESIMANLSKEDQTYYENLMYRLVLNTGSHMEEKVKTIDDMNFFDYISDADKQRTARDVICFLYKINPLHVKAHLQDKENAIEIIEAWCKAISV